MRDHITAHLGYFILQHHDTDFIPHARILAKGHRPDPAGPYEYMPVNSLTEGPIVGWHLLETEDQAVFPRLWVQSVGAAAKDGLWLPRGKSWLDPQKGLANLPAETPFDLGFPGGYPSVLIAGADMDEQAQLSAPAWAGLVVPTQGGSAEVSSVAWDVGAGGDLDTSARAPVTSAWRLYSIPRSARFGPLGVIPPVSAGGGGPPPPPRYEGIAWQLGLAPRGGNPGLGMVADDSPAGGNAKAILASASVNGGGMISVGLLADQHQIAITPDGEPVNAAHLSTHSIFIRPDGSADSTQEDGGRYRSCGSSPLLTRAWWRHDPERQHAWRFGAGAGLWRWQAEAWIGLIPRLPPPDDFPPEPPRQPPEEGKPFHPGGARITPRGGHGGIPAEPFPGEPIKPGQPLPPELIEPKPQGSDPRPLAGSVGEIGLRGIVFRASGDWSKFRHGTGIDNRNAHEELSREAHEEWRTAYAILRTDAAHDPAAIGGAEAGVSGAVPPASRYNHLAKGTLWFLPAEQGLEDVLHAANQNYAIANTDARLNPYTLGERVIAYARGVNLAFGSPAADAPWLAANGWQLGQSSATQSLFLWTLSSTGAKTIAATFGGGAASFVGTVEASTTLSAGTNLTTPKATFNSEAKTAILEQDPVPTWSVDKTIHIPYRSGVMALDMAVQIETGNFTAEINTIHAVKSTGGAYTCTLPGITDVLLDFVGGERITITDLDGGAVGNNITINTDTLDTIMGGTSIAIEDAYGSLTFMAVIDGVTGYWIIV